MEHVGKSRTLTAILYIQNFLMVALGGIFIYSGTEHLVSPIQFLRSITNYGILTAWWNFWLAFFLPSIQMCVGFGLLFKGLDRVSKYVSLILLLTFLIAQLSAYFRGIDIDCGCFGNYGSPVSLTSIASVASLFFISVLLVVGQYFESGGSAET